MSSDDDFEDCIDTTEQEPSNQEELKVNEEGKYCKSKP